MHFLLGGVDLSSLRIRSGVWILEVHRPSISGELSSGGYDSTSVQGSSGSRVGLDLVGGRAQGGRKWTFRRPLARGVDLTFL